MLKRINAAALVAAALIALPVAAYTPPVDTAGPLTVRIDGPATITTVAPFAITVTLRNAGDAALAGRLRMSCIDGWRIEPAVPAAFDVAAGATREYAFTVTPAAASFPAHYPVHAWAEFTSGGAQLTAHPVLIVEAQLPRTTRVVREIPWTPLVLQPNSGLALWRTPVRRVVLLVEGQPARTLPVGWQGTDAETRATAQFNTSTTRGGSPREGISMHPPYRGRPGSILVEYPVTLPSGQVRLQFANAMRDDDPGVTPGDGVNFRVRVLPIDAPAGQTGAIVFERQCTSKTWQAGEADLSRFAGQRIRLQLESHPGPKMNTAFDQSYWGLPTIIAGSLQKTLPPDGGRSLGAIGTSTREYQVRVRLGNRGLLDSSVSFAAPTATVSFSGFRVKVLGDALDDPWSPSILLSTRDESSNGRLRMRHSFRNWAGTFDVVGELWIEAGVLRSRFSLENAPAPRPWQAVYLESVSPGPWNATANRIYAGVGNVIEDPTAFTLPFDGHRLATSYAGYEFPGMSIVEGVDVPPTDLEVDPARRIYAMRAAHTQTHTFIAAPTAFAAAQAWREHNGLVASPGVAKLAGRFVFDLWGGNYAPSAASLEHAFHYGLTDSIVVWHNWQRWGYDYRLPDILPPSPKLGSEAEFAALSRACAIHGVLFAPHDNYIDYYPDAEGFSYGQIAFNGDGYPVRAWFNKGREAQSYRWRADRLFPSVERNVPLLKRAATVTGYFIDVWSSAGPYDYWTPQGEFKDRLSTRKVWAGTFTWIRNTLGDNAPQISESGHDQLIGSLDGAQTNHLRVDVIPPGEYGWAVWNIRAGDAERIPWLDAAHHDRFALHGAGYESRYTAGLDTALHGIYSDDYIATEVLDGHPAMVPSAFGRDVVRKYWLLHDLMRGLALTHMESHEFAGGDIHRQHVRWSGGGEVWVNRGKSDWTVAGHVLPEYGFYARIPKGNGAIEAAIELRDGRIVEWSRSPETTYVSARPAVSGRLPLALSSPQVTPLGGRRFRLTLGWNATGPIPDGYRIMVHFTDPAGKILFQGDHAGPGASGTWNGAFTTSVDVKVPDSIAPGQVVDLRAGLYSPAGGHRPHLAGMDDGTGRLRLGTLKLDAAGSVAFTAVAPPPEPLHPRFYTDGRAVAFDAVTTAGAVRLTRAGGALLVTPLPGGGEFEIRLPQPNAKVEALDEAGAALARPATRVDAGQLVITRDPAVFAYRVY